jgi:hypothetical protein
MPKHSRARRINSGTADAAPRRPACRPEPVGAYICWDWGRARSRWAPPAPTVRCSGARARSASFGGTGSNKSTVKYEASSDTLEVKLGSKSGGTIGKVTSGAATLNTDANLTDEFGNLFPAFTTVTTARL